METTLKIRIILQILVALIIIIILISIYHTTIHKLPFSGDVDYDLYPIHVYRPSDYEINITKRATEYVKKLSSMGL